MGRELGRRRELPWRVEHRRDSRTVEREERRAGRYDGSKTSLKAD